MKLESAVQALLGSFSAVLHAPVARSKWVLLFLGGFSHMSRALGGTTELTLLWSTWSHILQQTSTDLFPWQKAGVPVVQIETHKASRSLRLESAHHHSAILCWPKQITNQTYIQRIEKWTLPLNRRRYIVVWIHGSKNDCDHFWHLPHIS